MLHISYIKRFVYCTSVSEKSLSISSFLPQFLLQFNKPWCRISMYELQTRQNCRFLLEPCMVLYISKSIRIIAGKPAVSYLCHRNIPFSFIMYEEYKENSCTLICLILVIINTSLWIGKRCHVNVDYVNA